MEKLPSSHSLLCYVSSGLQQPCFLQQVWTFLRVLCDRVSLSFPGSLSRPICPPLFQKSGQASFICLVNCCKAVLQSCWRVNKPFISSSHDFIVPQLTASLVSDLQHECAGEAVLINTSKAETLYCGCYSWQFHIDTAVLFFHLCRRRSLNTWNHLTWRRTWMRLSRRSFPTLNWHWAR